MLYNFISYHITSSHIIPHRGGPLTGSIIITRITIMITIIITIIITTIMIAIRNTIIIITITKRRETGPLLITDTPPFTDADRCEDRQGLPLCRCPFCECPTRHVYILCVCVYIYI